MKFEYYVADDYKIIFTKMLNLSKIVDVIALNVPLICLVIL